MRSLALDATGLLLSRFVRSLRLFCLFRVMANRDLVVWAKVLWLAAIYFMPLVAVPAYLLLGNRQRGGPPTAAPVAV